MLKYIDTVKIECPDDWDEEKIQALKHIVEFRNLFLTWEDYSLVEAYYDKDNVLQVECLLKKKLGEEPEFCPEMYPDFLEFFNLLTVLFVSLVCYITYNLGIHNWDAPNLAKTFYLLAVAWACQIGKGNYTHLQWTCQITNRKINKSTTLLDRKIVKLLGILQSLAMIMAVLIWFI